MVFVPSAQDRKAKYLGSLGGVPSAYSAGINRTQNWKEKAIAGQGLYEEQMRNQDVLNRRRTGLEATNEAQWKSNALNLGTTRIVAGMTAAADKQTQNYERTAEALRAVELPARVADPIQNVQNRVIPIVQAAVNSKRR